jgi:pyruvate dehydrogenase E1 component
MYAGGQSILVGTPSGVTLSPEGGAHQSIITPSIGLEQPGCVAFEPAFGQDLEWTLLSALGRIGGPEGTSAYFRLSTRPIEQELASIPIDEELREQRRREVVAGGYLLRQAPQVPSVTLVGMGAVMPEVVAAERELNAAGVLVDIVCITSADLIFRAFQARQGIGEGDAKILEMIFPSRRSAPIVTVLDGHPHTLSFLAAINTVPIACLGVNDFGQVGDVDDLYQHFGIDSETIVGVAWDLVEMTSTAKERAANA